MNKLSVQLLVDAFIKSVFAGIMIGIAGAMYLTINNPPVGALFFSVGLIVICACEFFLYTGKIGYIDHISYPWAQIPIYICGNCLGTLLVALTQTVSTEAMITTKLAYPLWLVFLKSIGCGFLMYIAVNIFKTKNSYIGIIACIPAFILAGFEHSIADMFYFWLGGFFNLRVVIFIIIVILGNAIGANIHRLEKIKNF